MQSNRCGGCAPTPSDVNRKKDYELDEWGIYIADCYASNKATPPYLSGKAHKITAEHLVKNVFPQ